MAKKPVKTETAINPELQADLNGVDIDRASLLAKVGAVSVANAAKQAATLGDVPTDSGRQRMLALYFFGLGQADKKGVADVKSIFMASANTYYERGGANNRPMPKQGSLDRAIEAYGKFYAAGRLPYNAYPVVQHCLAMRNMPINVRGTKVLAMRNAHPDKAPTSEEIATAFAPAPIADKSIDTFLKALCSGFEARIKDDAFMTKLKATGGNRVTLFSAIALNVDTLRKEIEPDTAKNLPDRQALRGKVAALAPNVVTMKRGQKAA